MPEIKTRDAVKGTIKAIDKSAVVAGQMRDAFIRTKEKAQRNTAPAENSPEEYAADRVTGGVEAVSFGAAHEFDKLGRQSFRDTRENIEKAKDYLEKRKAAQPLEAAKKAAKKTKETARAAQLSGQTATYPHPAPTPASAPDTPAEAPQPMKAGARIKTIDRHHMAIRTRENARGTIKQPARRAGIRTRESPRTIKTVERGAQASANVTENAARTAQGGAKAAAKTAEKSAQTARTTAKAATEATKRASEAAARAARAAIAGTKALMEALVAGAWISVLIILIVVLLGVALSLFGRGSQRSAYEPVSAEVEAYAPIISLYAQRYGIGEYVELIKAVMMQESGGPGLDPMQASESGYNTRYPRTPNAITDPEYSIDVGIQALADALRMSGVESPIDLERISLALQGYNYGPGYISWALANYGGYSELNAIEFSNMMATRMGWSGYGDKAYVSHVLRYYPIGRVFMGEGNAAMVAVARQELGNVGGLKYCQWWGLDYRVEWCAIFVSWVADQCGYLEAGVLPKMEGVRPDIDWFKARGQWQGRAYEPSPGDIIFFDWQSDGLADHVGIVKEVEGGFVYTVEGNSGDACKENRYPVGSSVIYGYGLPAFDS